VGPTWNDIGSSVSQLRDPLLLPSSFCRMPHGLRTHQSIPKSLLRMALRPSTGEFVSLCSGISPGGISMSQGSHASTQDASYCSLWEHAIELSHRANLSLTSFICWVLHCAHPRRDLLAFVGAHQPMLGAWFSACLFELRHSRSSQENFNECRCDYERQEEDSS
jgi:hypothetical protein